MIADEEVRARYSDDVAIARKDGYVLVHLDRPDEDLIRVRTESFDPDNYFDDDCPLCGMQKGSAVCFFDDTPYDDEDVLLE